MNPLGVGNKDDPGSHPVAINWLLIGATWCFMLHQ